MANQRKLTKRMHKAIARADKGETITLLCTKPSIGKRWAEQLNGYGYRVGGKKSWTFNFSNGGQIKVRLAQSQ